jgi:hypothetical protein
MKIHGVFTTEKIKLNRFQVIKRDENETNNEGKNIFTNRWSGREGEIERDIHRPDRIELD